MILAIAVASAAGAQEPEPIGLEFQVNVVTTGSQGNPVVRSRADGSFVVVWESKASDNGDLVHRIFDSFGTPISGEVPVNNEMDGEQAARSQAISVLPDGGFVVTWDNLDSGLIERISARRFLSDGQPDGSQFQVNTITTEERLYPSVAATPDGSFAIVWESYVSSGTDSDSRSIQMRLWDPDGSPVAPEFQVNTYTTSTQDKAAIAYSDTAGFIVAWSSEGSPGNDSDTSSLQVRRVEADGSAIGDQFQVNTYTTGSADNTRIAVGPGGQFMITWRSYGSPGDDGLESSTQARRFSSDGAPIGDQFQVNDYTLGSNDDADPVFDEVGGFLVTWESEPDKVTSASPDGAGDAVQLRRFLLDGTPVGEELTVNDFTLDDQDDPVLAVLGPERAVVVFESRGSFGSDSSGASVQARIFDLCPGPNDGLDDDFDSIPDDCDLCQGDNSTGDGDADGVCDDRDACLGDDAFGDGDGDGVCADRDCNDEDPSNGCAIFADDFEAGDTSNWSQSQ